MSYDDEYNEYTTKIRLFLIRQNILNNISNYIDGLNEVHFRCFLDTYNGLLGTKDSRFLFCIPEVITRDIFIKILCNFATLELGDISNTIDKPLSEMPLCINSNIVVLATALWRLRIGR